MKKIIWAYIIILFIGIILMAFGIKNYKPISETSVEPEQNTKSDKPEYSEPGNSPLINIKVTDNNNSNSNENSIVANNRGAVFIGWQDSRYSSTTQCCFSISIDSGTTWENPRCLTRQSNSRHAGDATVATDYDGTFYAICHDYSRDEIRISYSKDDGQTWSPWNSVQTAIDKPWAGGLGDGILYLSWLGNPGGWKRSLDYGETWESVRSFGYINHGTTFGVSVNGHVHILYNKNNRDLRYVRSLDSGRTAEPERILVANMGRSGYASTGADPRQHPIVGGGSDITGKYVVAVWSADMTNSRWVRDDIYTVISEDFGETWSNPIRVGENTSQRKIQIWAAADKWGRFHFVWTDFRHGEVNAVYYNNFLDGEFSQDLEITTTRSSINNFFGDYKGITVQGDDVLFSWTSAGDIYFAKGEGFAENPDPVSIVHRDKINPKFRFGKSGTYYNIKGQKIK